MTAAQWRERGPAGTLLGMETPDTPSILSRLMRRLHAPVYASRLAGLVAEMAPHLRPGDRVLDVGCGGGRRVKGQG